MELVTSSKYKRLQRSLIFAQEKGIGAKTLRKCLEFWNESNKCRASLRMYTEGDKIIRAVSIHAADPVKVKCKQIISDTRMMYFYHHF